MSLWARGRPSRSWLAVAALLVAANVGLFVLIAESVTEGGRLAARDDAVLRWFVDHRTDWLIDIAKVIGVLASFVSLLLIAALFAVWLTRRGCHLGLAVAPLTSLVLASIASTVAKAAFDRQRPPVTVRATTVTLASFPSGHSTNAAAFFLAAAAILAITTTGRASTRILLLGASLLIVVVVGMSRLVLAVHWLSDVLAGWSLGTAVAITTAVTAWFLTVSVDAEPTETVKTGL